jgi:hypothetical protein
VGNVGVLVGAPDVLVMETEVLDESLEEAIEVTGIVESEDVAVAIQLHALLTRLATLPVQAATANNGIALAAVTGPDVKVPKRTPLLRGGRMRAELEGSCLNYNWLPPQMQVKAEAKRGNNNGTTY